MTNHFETAQGLLDDLADPADILHVSSYQEDALRAIGHALLALSRTIATASQNQQ